MAEVQVPALVLARPILDALAWRAARRDEAPRRVALVTDGGSRMPTGALQSAGFTVAGLLGPDALESIAWAAEVGIGRAYADLAALLSDEIDAVAIDLPAPRCDVLLAAAAKADLHVLLISPRLGDLTVAGDAVLSLEESDLHHAVAFLGRADPGYVELGKALRQLGPATQLTARGWPAGGPPRAELVDLVRRWCGEIVAVCADPQAMPAASLGEDDPITLALLTETGATVLASERFAARQFDVLLTAITANGRAVLNGTSLTVTGEPTRTVGRAAAVDAVSFAARSLLGPDSVAAATVSDLLAAWRVLAAIEVSRVDGGWVELS